MKSTLLTLALCLAASTSLQAQEPLQIIGYPVPTLVVYDAQGEQIGELSRESMPAPRVPVLEVNQAGDLLRIALKDKQIWLDPADLQLNQGGKGVQLSCRELRDVSVPVDEQIAATMGYATACGDAQ
jgi:hypothetical protein